DRLITNQLLWPTELCWRLSISKIGLLPDFVFSSIYELRPEIKSRPLLSKRSAKIDTNFLFTKEKVKKN
ncbi:MAG: hypothetical protein C0598_13310, partial [Marinilabiliales bacterium]